MLSGKVPNFHACNILTHAQSSLVILQSRSCHSKETSKMSAPNLMGSSVQTQHECMEGTQELLSDIVRRLSLVGMSVHVIKNRVVLSNAAEEGEAFAIVDGDEALKFVNEPKYADKILCVGSERFHCHSEYLSLRSEYFRALFRGDFQETSMDIVSVLLPAPGNFEPVLRFLYSGLADAVLFSEEEIFRTIQNSNFLGIESLLSRTVEAFAQKWKVLAKSPLFRRSLVPFEFVVSVLDVGTKKNLFKDGETLRVVTQWNEENSDPCEFPETKRLLLERRCLQSAGIADLEWAIGVNEKLFTSLGQTELRCVYRRAAQENERAKEKIKAAEIKVKGLMQYMKTLSSKLEEVKCSRCGESVPRVALKSRTCLSLKHSGEYAVNRGWSCCGELIKRSRGCKPVNVSRHRVGARS